MSHAGLAKNVFLVTLVTVLVWLFAESESLREKTVGVAALIDAAPAGDVVVSVPDGQGWRERVDVVFRGSAAAIDELEARLRRTGLRLAAGMEGFPIEPGEYQVDTRAVLRAHADLRGAGVTIAAVQPPSVRVLVDRLVEREVGVRVEIAPGEVEGAPSPRPNAVRVLIPALQAGSLAADAQAIARIDAAQLADLAPGQARTVKGVRLALPPGVAPAARILPGFVDVDVTLKSRSATIQLPSIPVHLKIAPVEYARWLVDIPEEKRFLAGVSVTGPAEVIEQIRRGEIKVTAIVPLSFEELERGLTAKEAVFSELPTPLRFDVVDRTIPLIIRRREPVGGNGGAAPDRGP